MGRGHCNGPRGHMGLGMARGHHGGPGAGGDGECQNGWVGGRGHWAGEAPGDPAVTSPPRAGVRCNRAHGPDPGGHQQPFQPEPALP